MGGVLFRVPLFILEIKLSLKSNIVFQEKLSVSYAHTKCF